MHSLKTIGVVSLRYDLKGGGRGLSGEGMLRLFLQQSQR